MGKRPTGAPVKLTAKHLELLLRAKYKVPETVIKELRMVYCDRSVQDAEEVKMNRIYTVAALALRRYTAVKGVAWGRKRLIEWLQTFSDLYEQFIKSGDRWHDLMLTLRNEAGIVIRTGEEGDEICEYDDENVREENT